MQHLKIQFYFWHLLLPAAPLLKAKCGCIHQDTLSRVNMIMPADFIPVLCPAENRVRARRTDHNGFLFKLKRPLTEFRVKPASREHIIHHFAVTPPVVIRRSLPERNRVQITLLQGNACPVLCLHENLPLAFLNIVRYLYIEDPDLSRLHLVNIFHPVPHRHSPHSLGQLRLRIT